MDKEKLSLLYQRILNGKDSNIKLRNLNKIKEIPLMPCISCTNQCILGCAGHTCANGCSGLSCSQGCSGTQCSASMGSIGVG